MLKFSPFPSSHLYHQHDRFCGIPISPLTKRRLALFKNHKRGYYSFVLLSLLFIFTLLAELIANDKPVIMYYNDQIYFPALIDYYETDIGEKYDMSINYKDPYINAKINENGWMIWPPITYHYKSINYHAPYPAPGAPQNENWLGTDDQGRDVLARLIYGFRLSLVFGIFLTIVSSIVGIAAGAIQGFYGGRIDLYAQRFIEIWSGLPSLFIIIIMTSVVKPSFWLLVFILFLFNWTSLVSVVRAEFLKTRNFEYVKAARALGVGSYTIMFRHMLPNAMVATLTFLPFILNTSITTLTALDFLGFGMPAGSPSLGDLLAQGKSNIQAPWLGLTAFFTLAFMMSCLIFIGEAIRDAFDPQKTLV